uniref:Helix-turn-helix domain-containing protein n=1 Tax=Leptospirillum ferriphilum TaxID=178606 RepID=A0A7C3LUI0_9BACT
MTPEKIKPFDMDLAEVAELLMKTPGSLYKRIQRGTIGDLPIYNIGTSGKGKRYAARGREIHEWLERRRRTRT